MGVTLPGYLDQALDVIGISWPNVDEDDYRDMAKSMREFADDVEDGTGEAHQALLHVFGNNEGLVVEALDAHWSKLKGVHLKNLAEAGRLTATALDAVAGLIEGAKMAAIAQLVILAGEIAAALAAEVFTFGLSTLGGLAATQTTRIAVKRIFKEVCEQAGQQVVDTAMGPVYEALGSMAGDLAVQAGGNALGVHHGIDLGQAGQAGKDGLGAGGQGKLTLAGVDGGGGGEEGRPAKRMRVDPDSYDRAGSGLLTAGGKIRDGAGGKLGEARGHHSRARGRDPLTAAADEALDKVVDGVGDAVRAMAGHLDDTLHHGMKNTAGSHRANEDRTKTEIDSVKPQRVDDSHPHTYYMDDAGKVHRLSPSGRSDLDDEDRGRLSALGLDGGGSVAERKVGDYRLPRKTGKRPRPTKSSEQVGFGSTDLSRATQWARHSEGNGEGDYGGRNYASARYGSKEDGDDGFIVAGRSQRNGARHSERMVGIPFLNSQKSEGMTELYTEREPCTTGRGAANCSAWMKEHLPDGVKVSHSAEYGATPESKAAGNAAMGEYLKGLKASRGAR